MKKYVGVKSFAELIIAYNQPQIGLKRDALIFEGIAIPNFSSLMSVLFEAVIPSEHYILRELEWLYDKGIIIEPDTTMDQGLYTANEEYRRYALAADAYSTKSLKYINLAERQKRNQEKHYAQGFMNYALASQYLCRLVSIELRERKDLDAYPAFSRSLEPIQSLDLKKRGVIQVVISALPTIDESTPWEKLIEYRSDPDSIVKFLALRNWMSELARANLTPIEIEEKLEWLLHEYKRHLELHKLKTKSGILETVIVSIAEFLEDVANRKFSKIANGLFKVKQRKIALLEAESNAPGKEVAYIQKAREIFQKGND